MKDELREWLKEAVNRPDATLARSNQGLLLRYTQNGRDLVIKTPAGSGMAWRLRRAMLKREHRAYQRLQGVPGVPRCHGLLDGRYLVLDHIDGHPFRGARMPDRERFFAQLLETIQAMHERGVAHGDLKRKSNLMVSADGAPVVLDFGAAIRRKPGPRPLNHRLFKLLRQTDLNAWVKLKHGGYENVPDTDRKYLRSSLTERVLRSTRKFLTDR